MKDPKTKFLTVLNDIKNKRPCWIGQWLTLRIKSSVFQGKNPAWACGNKIYISPHYQNIEDADIIRYLIAHEYGHVYHYHTILRFLLWIIFIPLLCVILIMCFPWFATDIGKWFLGFVLISIIWHFNIKAEFEADKMVADIYGPKIVLKGLEWGKENDFSKARKQRISKINELINKRD